jgi:hypothetical protein
MEKIYNWNKRIDIFIYGRPLKAEDHLRQLKSGGKIVGFFLLAVGFLYLLFYYLYMQS